MSSRTRSGAGPCPRQRHYTPRLDAMDRLASLERPRTAAAIICQSSVADVYATGVMKQLSHRYGPRDTGHTVTAQTGAECCLKFVVCDGGRGGVNHRKVE